MAVGGPGGAARQLLEHMAIVLDTYLSVSTPVQIGLPRLLAAGDAIRQVIDGRLRQNLDVLRGTVRRSPALTLIEPEGGWTAVLRVPAVESEEQIVLDLVATASVLVHPGYFFDFAEEAFLVVSLLPRPDVFAEAVSRIVGRLGASS
jgi:aspartate/methionine/tyrosine aminotransferase